MKIEEASNVIAEDSSLKSEVLAFTITESGPLLNLNYSNERDCESLCKEQHGKRAGNATKALICQCRQPVAPQLVARRFI